MNYDVILAGIGGQGVKSTGIILSRCALHEGLYVQQSELHGMAQRGGSVQVQVRIADHPVASALVSRGGAACIIGMDPVEGLRQIAYLAHGGRFITSLDPVNTAPGHPDEAFIKKQIQRIPGHVAVSIKELLGETYGAAANMALLGIASKDMPMIPARIFEEIIEETFAAEEQILEINVYAFRKGRDR